MNGPETKLKIATDALTLIAGADLPDNNDDEHDLLEELIGEAGAALHQIGKVSEPMNFYAIIGRLCGDDEDTVLTFRAESKEDAIAQFYEAALEIWGLTHDELVTLEANGEGFFINNVLISSAPIHEA